MKLSQYRGNDIKKMVLVIVIIIAVIAVAAIFGITKGAKVLGPRIQQSKIERQQERAEKEAQKQAEQEAQAFEEEQEALLAETEETDWETDESYDTAQEESEYYEEENTGSGYIISDSDSRYLTRSDLEGLDANQLRLARNEIYARHGRRFDDSSLQAYFDSQEWYYGSVAPADFSDNMLNDYERKNATAIADYEKEMGYR